jgi:hypothetical protein
MCCELDGEGYNFVKDVCRYVTHPFDEVDGVLDDSGVCGTVCCGWSRHDRVERMAHAWLREFCGSR